MTSHGMLWSQNAGREMHNRSAELEESENIAEQSTGLVVRLSHASMLGGARNFRRRLVLRLHRDSEVKIAAHDTSRHAIRDTAIAG